MFSVCSLGAVCNLSIDILAAALVRLGAACVSGVTLLLRMVFALTSPSRVVAGTLCCAVAATAVAAGADAEAQKRSYRLPHGEAATILAQFATESGRPILYMMDQVRGERTNALTGSYTPREALDRLLAGTALVAVHDPKSGGFIINRRAAPSKQEHAEAEKARGPPNGHATPLPDTPKTNQPKHTESPTMKKRTFLAIIAGWFLTTNAVNSQTAETSATISGTVSNASTNNMLEGAKIELLPFGLQTYADQAGRYVLTGVPAGTHVVRASYLGLDPLQEEVTASLGQHINRDFRLTTGIYRMSEFKVTGEREGAAAAITAQRNATNLANVVATDSFGNLPNLSAGEMAIRLPGVTGFMDQEGNVNTISVRGMANTLNSVNVDGALIANQEGLNRNFQMHTLSGALFEEIELTKGHTPDKGADSLGGTINLKTRSTLGMADRRRISYNLGVRIAPTFFDHPPLRDGHRTHPLTSLGYQEVFNVFGGQRNLGLAVNLFYSENASSAFFTTRDFENTTLQPAYVWDYRTQENINNRKQQSSNVKLEYRLSPNTKFSLSFQGGNNNEPFQRWYETRAFAAQSVGLTGTAGILPGYTSRITQIRAASGSTIQTTMTQLSFLQRMRNVNFGAEHQFGRLLIDYNAAWSKASVNALNGEGGVLINRITNVGWILDRTQSDLFPRFIQTEGPDFTNPSNYRPAPNGLSTRHNDQDHRFRELRTNVRYKILTQVPVFVKSGFQLREQAVDHLNLARRWNYLGTVPLPADSSIRLFDTEKTGRRIPQWESAAYMKNGEPADPSLWAEDRYYAEQLKYTGARAVRERVSAGYLMADGRLGRDGILKRTTFLAGVRMERTETESYGWVRAHSASTVAQQLADPVGSAVRDYGSTRRELEGGYTKSFPSVHLTHDFTPNLKGRLSRSTSFGRPGMANLLPNETFNDTQQTLTINNPGLLPQTASNWDASLDYYFEPVGNLSVGWFRKTIRDFIVSGIESGTVPTGPDNGYNGEYSGYRILTARNAGTALVRGWEVSYQQQFTFLPGLLKGAAFSANHTWLDTEGNFGGAARLSTGQVANFVPRTGNASLSWRYRNFGSRVLLNYTSAYINSYSALSPGQNRYRYSRTVVNLGMSYKLRSSLALTCDIDNIFNEPQRFYRGIPDQMQQTYLNAPTITIGVNGRF